MSSRIINIHELTSFMPSLILLFHGVYDLLIMLIMVGYGNVLVLLVRSLRLYVY